MSEAQVMNRAMSDILNPAERSKRMSNIRQKDTDLERSVRSTLHKLGFRFRISRRDLPGTPDIVLPKWNTAVFVNGCFWHAHDCHFFRLPGNRASWWESKLKKNVGRDRDKTAALQQLGWRVLVVWKCALMGKTRLSDSEFESLLSRAIVQPFRLLEIRGKDSSVPPRDFGKLQ
jgi:DNA mismatch endonuclease (patch repair protein)